MDHATSARAAFPLTRWSIVLAARGEDGGSPGARAALTELCRLYWYPLYAFARRDGWKPEDAEDLTQDFFARMLKVDLLAQTSPGAGRLRTFLLVTFQHDLSDARRHARREKRGGGVEILSIDHELAEGRFQHEPADAAAPALIFERQWAVAVLEAAMNRLAAGYTEAGRGLLFDALRPFLNVDDEEPLSYDNLCTATGLSKPAARQAVHRLRERFRESVRSHIADTLRDPDEARVDEEVAALGRSLAE